MRTVEKSTCPICQRPVLLLYVLARNPALEDTWMCPYGDCRVMKQPSERKGHVVVAAPGGPPVRWIEPATRTPLSAASPQTDRESLMVACSTCRQSVTLHMAHWSDSDMTGRRFRKPSDLLPAIWECPHCHTRNRGRFEGRIAYATKPRPTRGSSQ